MRQYRLPSTDSQVILLRVTADHTESRAHATAGRERERPVPHSALDEKDKTIIRHLQEDGRMPFSKLGPLVGLSPAAARQRVLQLIEQGTMQIVAVTDPISLGFKVQALIGLRVTGDLDALAAKVSAMSEADYVVVVTGRFDLIAEIVCVSNSHFLDVLRAIRDLPGVQTAEVFTYLRLEKQTYDWGTT